MLAGDGNQFAVDCNQRVSLSKQKVFLRIAVDMVRKHRVLAPQERAQPVSVGQAIATRNTLVQFLRGHGAKMVVVRETQGVFYVSWYATPSPVHMRARLEGQLPIGVKFELASHGRWWACKRLLAASVRVLLTGRLVAP